MKKILSVYLFITFSLQPLILHAEIKTVDFRKEITELGCFSKQDEKRKKCAEEVIQSLSEEEKFHFSEVISESAKNKYLNVNFVPYKNKEKDELRVHLEDEKNVNTTLAFDENGIKQINNVFVNSSEVNSINSLFVKMIRSDRKFRNTYLQNGGLLPVAISSEMFHTLTAEEQFDFMAKMRVLIESANEVQIAFSDSNEETVSQMLFQNLLINKSYAKVGDSCIVAGNISKETSTGSCDPKPFQKNCDSGRVECNSSLYGYSSSGSSYCVSGGSSYVHATKECHNQVSSQQYPEGKSADNNSNSYTAEEKKKIIDSFLQKKGKEKTKDLVEGKFDAKDKEKIDLFLNQAMKKDGPILKMSEKCQQLNQGLKNASAKKIESRKSACIGLQASLFEVEYAVQKSICLTEERKEAAAATVPTPVVAKSDGPATSKLPVCTAEKPMAEKMTTTAGSDSDKVVKKTTSSVKRAPAKQKSFWERSKNWLIPLITGVVGFIAGYSIKKTKTKTKIITKEVIKTVPATTPASEGGTGTGGAPAGGVL